MHEWVKGSPRITFLYHHKAQLKSIFSLELFLSVLGEWSNRAVCLVNLNSNSVVWQTIYMMNIPRLYTTVLRY